MAWEPQPGPQSSAILADWCDELFYGGERGGGKSDFQLGYQEDGALKYAGSWRGIMFRKTYPELEELQSRALEIFPASGGFYKSQPSADYPFSNCWYWKSGASVKMRYIEREQDYGRYHGHSYTGISSDEVTEYATPGGILKMMSTLRSPHGVPCTMRETGNPGGIGHGWVKARHIDIGPPMTPYEDPETGFTRMFIPSRLADNQLLLESDPGYRSRILAATAGNEALREAWLNGNWDIVAGAFFSEFKRETHVIKPFNVPGHWLRFRAFDWGSRAPFSFGWWAVSDGTELPDGRIYPAGALINYREWYGAKLGGDGVWHGLVLTADKVAREALSMERGEKITYGVADPACWITQGGPSIAEAMLSQGLVMHKADNRRIPGWDQVRSRLVGDDYPMVYVFDTCQHLIRTLPLLQVDPKHIEDADTTGEDHAPDQMRYALMSRPFIRKAPEIQEPKFGHKTFNELRDLAKKRRESER